MTPTSTTQQRTRFLLKIGPDETELARVFNHVFRRGLSIEQMALRPDYRHRVLKLTVAGDPRNLERLRSTLDEGPASLVGVEPPTAEAPHP